MFMTKIVYISKIVYDISECFFSLFKLRDSIDIYLSQMLLYRILLNLYPIFCDGILVIYSLRLIRSNIRLFPTLTRKTFEWDADLLPLCKSFILCNIHMAHLFVLLSIFLFTFVLKYENKGC